MIKRGLFLALSYFISVHAVTWVPTTSPSIGTNSNNPFIALDRNGNTLALWSTGLVAGNYVNSSYLPAGSTTWIDLRTVVMGSGYAVTPVAMNASGLGVGAWDDIVNMVVGMGIYNSATASWGAIQTFPPSSDPAVAINESGTAVAIAVVNTATDLTISFYNGSWSIPTSVTGSSVSMVNNPVVGIDNSGFVIVMWDGVYLGTRSIQTTTYNPNTMMWSHPVATISPAGQQSVIPAIAVNPATGNAIAGWTNDATAQAQFSFYNGTSWSTPLSVPDANSFFPMVGLDGQGNAFVSWLINDGGKDVLRAARIPFGSSTWGPITTISNPADSVFVYSFAVDPLGDAAAVWEVGGAIYGSVISGGSNTWAPETVLATSNSLIPTVAISVQGKVTAAWRPSSPGISSGATTQILGSPSTLTGKQKTNRFLAQSELYNQLNWSASATPSVVFYRVYRNGVLIAETDDLDYQDHHRLKGEVNVYTVTSVDSSGNESSPQTVTVP